MKIDVYRSEYGPRSTPGEMFIDGQRECFTLEPAKDKPFHEGHPCIPAGTYEIRLTFSPHLQHLTPEVMDVPGRTAIRIHKANKPEELLGCTAVGEVQREDMVLNSAGAFERMMVLLKQANDHGERITAEWHDPTL